jgi:REP element-mobilizing transposase RayT
MLLYFVKQVFHGPERRTPPHFPPIEKRNRPILIFLTVCTQSRERCLDNWYVYRALHQAWRQADAWLVGRFIVLPDHVHLFCFPAEVIHPPLSSWVRFWKRSVSLVIRLNQPSFHWQRNFWDTQVRSSDLYHGKWLYVLDNPVRHGLVSRAADWPFSGELNEFFWTSD